MEVLWLTFESGARLTNVCHKEQHKEGSSHSFPPPNFFFVTELMTENDK